MQLVHTDEVFRVEPGTTPNYNRANPLVGLLGLVEGARLAAGREAYLAEQLQYLVPFERLELYGPSSPESDVLDPTRQDVKTDFQKQNVRRFLTGDTLLVRGFASAGDWTGPFLRLSYRGGPDSRLSAASRHRLGPAIKLWLKVGQRSAAQPIVVPYNAESDRYEVELWGFPGADLAARLDERGRAALARGEIVPRPDLVPGGAGDFDRDGIGERYVVEVAPEHAMHPILPLRLELAWADEAERVWDSQDGANYRYAFTMLVRGWDHFLGAGVSASPHGGVGFLEYRNLLSNYGRYAGSGELGRTPAPWSFDANGSKRHDGRRERFFAVDYVDLHAVRPSAGIGLHRHRDNQELFLMMEGSGLMVVGDWCRTPERERCFEVRTLRAGHLAMLKGGNLHGLMNPSDENLYLFMLGGYD